MEGWHVPEVGGVEIGDGEADEVAGGPNSGGDEVFGEDDGGAFEALGEEVDEGAAGEFAGGEAGKNDDEDEDAHLADVGEELGPGIHGGGVGHGDGDAGVAGHAEDFGHEVGDEWVHKAEEHENREHDGEAVGAGVFDELFFGEGEESTHRVASKKRCSMESSADS